MQTIILTLRSALGSRRLAAAVGPLCGRLLLEPLLLDQLDLLLRGRPPLRCLRTPDHLELTESLENKIIIAIKIG